MKTRLTLMAIAMLLCLGNLNAQFCGYLPNTCTSAGTLSQPGFTPSEDIPCIVPNVPGDFTIQFKNFTQITYQGQVETVDSLTIDSIGNLPAGFCWSSEKYFLGYAPNEEGCIKISGGAYGPADQYKLQIYVTVKTTNGWLQWIDAEEIGLKVYLRVAHNSAIPCLPVNNSQTEPFVPQPLNEEEVVQVKGTVFRDLNNNGVKDGNDFGAINVHLTNGSDVAITNSQGEYSFFLLAGSHTISIVNSSVQSAYTFSPAQLTVTGTVLGNVYGGNDFAVALPQGYCKANLSFSASNPPARPGFTNTVYPSVYNQYANGPISGTLRLKYNNSQVIQSVTPAPSNIDTVARFIEWSTGSIPLSSSFSPTVIFYTPQSIVIGTQHIYTVSLLNSDCNGMDTASYTYYQSVVGSYDPNDKSVSPIGFGTNNGINPDNFNELTYTIRFQNTGTFYAEKVEIVDTISPKLDLTTLQVTTASHNYAVRVGADRAVKFIFNQIMLPDSNTNEPESHGFVQYKIKLNPALTQNTVINNKADIYFDFNDPIRTNTAYNTIDFSTAIKEVAAVSGFNIFPNPTTGSVQIAADEQLAGKRLKVTDISGRVLLQRIVDVPVMTIQLSDLASGIYLIQVEGSTKRLVKE